VRMLALKAWRDLAHLRGQSLAIALVIASGVAMLVMAQSTYHSLEGTRARFYADYAFADVWAGAKRAPEALAARLADIPGVQTVETRVAAPATLVLADFADPVRAQVLSLPEDGRAPQLNRLHLRRGRLPLAQSRDEAVVSEAFAEAHGLQPGDTLDATLYGRRQRLRLVGIALSPEFVYQIQPGAVFPDFRRYAIVWMNRHAMEAALDMDGAFNSVALRLRPGVDAESVITAVDALLGRYGGLGAYARKDQLSNRFLSEELRQLATMARLFPAIFLSVAAFLLNVVMARLIGMQRDQVAVLKAFGYSTGAVSLHYLGMVALIALAGALIGLAGGGLLGHFLAGVYQNFYRFPFLDYGIDRGALFGGIGVSLAAAAAGALQAVRRASALPPAEAMRPPAPPRYRASHLERLGLGRLLATPGRMVMRELERRPWKALLSVVGLALACAIMMVGRFQRDAIDRMVDVHLRLAQQQDWSVDFTEPAGRAALFEIAALPDVAAAEPYRGVAVRLRHGTRSYRTGIEGLPADGVLKRTLDIDLRAWRPPRDGLLLTDYLAEWLGVAPGDRIEVEVLEGRQARLEVPVAAVLPEYIGVQAYMDLDALNHLLGDGEVISGVRLRGASVPPAQAAARDARLVAELERRPRVAGVGARLAAIRSFYETMGESMLVFTFVSLLLGGVINFGVVYNSARIALSERGRELASLRVLGFTRQEVGSILLGELGTLVALATPLGFLAGIGLCWVMSRGFQSDLFRVPVRLAASTYALAALTMLASTLLSAVLVRRRIAQLDLIGVLKTRE